MAYGDPYPHGFPSGPIWIDPNYLQYHRWGRGWTDRTITTTGTQPFVPLQPVDEERIRKIVREEIAELPIPFDVPDAPPEGTDG